MRRQYDPSLLAQFVASGSNEKEKAESVLFQSINMDMPAMPVSKEKMIAAKKKEKRRPAGIKVANDVDVNGYDEKEALEEWMNNLQHRLHEACSTTSESPSSGGSTSAANQGVASPDARPGRRTTAFPFPDVSSRGKESENADHQNRSTAKAGKNSNEGKGRWKSAINLSDQTVEFLTDSDYLGQLQGKIQKKSIDILYERLAERKDSADKPHSARPKGDGSKNKVGKKKKESSSAAEKVVYDD